MLMEIKSRLACRMALDKELESLKSRFSFTIFEVKRTRPPPLHITAPAPQPPPLGPFLYSFPRRVPRIASYATTLLMAPDRGHDRGPRQLLCAFTRGVGGEGPQCYATRPVQAMSLTRPWPYLYLSLRRPVPCFSSSPPPWARTLPGGDAR